MSANLQAGKPVTAAPQAPLSAFGFVDAVLRGVSQVMLQNNRYVGLVFVVGIASSSPLFALAAVLGTVVSTATAAWLGVDRTQLRAGLFGFNGTLVAIALLVFLQPTALTWACVVFAAAATAVVTAALAGLLKVWDVPPLTAPFVLVSWCFFLATARLGRLEPTGLLPAAMLPKAATVEGVVGLATMAEGLCNGVAQVFFQQSVLAGVVFTIGLFLASWRAGAAALLGSAVGLLLAWWLGAAETAIRAGVFGFNNVLVAVALSCAFRTSGRAAMFAVLLATAATTLVAAAVSAAVQPVGLPGLTLPFVLVTWMFLWARKSFRRLRSPEAHGQA